MIPGTLVTGTGAPVTVVAHGLGASLAETRPLAGGVAGTRVFSPAIGHGATPLGDLPVDYALLAADLAAVLDAHGATQLLGVSMGAAAALRLLTTNPHRLQRAVLLLPPTLDGLASPRPRAAALRLADAIESADAAVIEAELTGDLPADLRDLPAARHYVASRARFLAGSPGVAGVLRGLAGSVAVPDLSALRAVGADVLVVGQEGDPLHPARAARELAATLPRARLVVFDEPGMALRHAPRLRALVGGFLSGG